MYVVQVRYRRPGANIPWYTHRPAYLESHTEQAKADGDLLFQHWERIDDLSALYLAVWRDHAAWQKWVQSDPFVTAHNRVMDAYNDQLGIITEREERE